MAKIRLRTLFVVGTALSIVAFLGLTIDTLRQIPARTHEEALSAQVVAGKIAWQAHDCTDCHTLLGNGAYYAPDLTKVVDRRGAPFLHTWLTAPGGQMPAQHLTAAEVVNLVAFLDWVGKIDTNGWPPAPIAQAAAGQGAAGGLASQGVALFQQKGCAACHGSRGEGTAAAPKLTGVTQARNTAYLSAWLANPQAVNAAATMPNLGLQAADVQALIAYLETLQ